MTSRDDEFAATPEPGFDIGRRQTHFARRRCEPANVWV